MTTTTHRRSQAGEETAGGLVTFAGILLFIAGLLDLLGASWRSPGTTSTSPPPATSSSPT
ncbi:hypothetical protein [Streptomyces incanus]|uniref:Uncharacterized protein n=1 Tax=Streptomyces incanus TaxID=887453 RepID=A0ABW0XXM6_9ACTN